MTTREKPALLTEDEVSNIRALRTAGSSRQTLALVDRIVADHRTAAEADERARIAWWLRAAADGPGRVNHSDDYLLALTEMADAIEQHPERFEAAPPHRRPTYPASVSRSSLGDPEPVAEPSHTG